jgi:ParB family chromosome partitioning protein
MIQLSDIKPSPNNPRQHFDDKKFAELVASIKQNGVSQPILVRPINGAKAGKAKFQIVAGERRYRASSQLGLKDIPAHIKAMSDGEASSARLYVARRLALTNLIEAAREDFRKERLKLAHVLELCRYAPEIQTEALMACYETRPVQNKNKDGYDYVPDKTRPARHVRHLQDWLMQNVHLNPQQAPFKPDDVRLREDGVTCVNCPQRTGHDKLLFADIKSSDTCLNPLCFQAKLQQFVQITKAGVEAKQGKPAVLISNHYGSRTEGEGILGRDQYQILQKKVDRCEYAEQSVYTDGAVNGSPSSGNPVSYHCYSPLPDCESVNFSACATVRISDRDITHRPEGIGGNYDSSRQFCA